jgi:geranylgeranyl reductase family protein
MTGTAMRCAEFSRRLSTDDDRLWDVLVVGAGPAGAAAAYRLALAGFSVLLLDKKAFPREKICGDALIPDALSGLRALGLYETVRSLGLCVDRLTVISPSGIRVELPAECVTLKRETLDALLLQHGVAKGVAFRVAKVADLREGANGVTARVAGSHRELRARIAVLATGADVALLDRLKMVERAQPSAVAVRCYVRSPVDISELIVSYDRAISPGYGWIFPLRGNEYNVGCGIFFRGAGSRKVNLRHVFDKFTKDTVQVRRLMQNRQATTPLKGARLRSGLDGAILGVGNRVVPVGEAIGATYPFTGEGIGKAIETAAVAAEYITQALEQDDLEPMRQLPGEIRRRLAPRYEGYLVAQRWLSRPWLADLVATRVRASSRLRDTAAGIINETVDPKVVFNWRTLIPKWERKRTRIVRSDGVG